MGTGLKAYNVFPGEYPQDSGCVLAFAETASKARYMVARGGPWPADIGYMDFRAWRVKRFDDLADRRRIVETNDDLPKDRPFFNDSIV